MKMYYSIIMGQFGPSNICYIFYLFCPCHTCLPPCTDMASTAPPPPPAMFSYSVILLIIENGNIQSLNVDCFHIVMCA